jgi:uncharacterized membrane protein
MTSSAPRSHAQPRTSTNTVPIFLVAAIVLTRVLHLAWSYESLPKQVAAHFDFSGRPNGYQHKLTFAAISVGVELAMFLLLLAIPSMIHKSPTGAINLPNREYWLAPERRAATVATLTSFIEWFMVATSALVSGVFVLIARANLEAGRLGWSANALMILYLVFTLSWAISLTRAFRAPRT